MKITHVLNDGTKLDDITGHVVKMGEAESVYNLIDLINQKQEGKRKKDEKEAQQNKG